MFFSLFLKSDVNTNLIQMTVSYCFCYLVTRQWCPGKRGLWFTCHLTNVFSDSTAIRTSSDWSRQYHWSDKNGVKMASPCSKRATDWQQYTPQSVKRRILESYLKIVAIELSVQSWHVCNFYSLLVFAKYITAMEKTRDWKGEPDSMTENMWFYSSQCCSDIL